ncbi:hypothetical protein CBS115989_10281 [Aspergillus niger]|uniref:Urease accessory protein UreD n=1 Tax=Aspergillus niger ATCC 13496 TaxID=1353008 RepID=A0A370C2S5_ASPNG|nr:hypothetical protein ANI_1_1678134 [Aspergillus niger CBS 513.88]XP_025453317.1 uncharacterized protein BO96DRAFT_457517 [Aspergillus niger CBS 101883]KAI2812592.1 hypothetical protein CBS115989_10281 [Aspergillus niger]RDH22207.1 hypothetical protein M747DRAFT_368948 [Aspergillus niger ATCC 13496]KAI2834396.1 hypothetical protein CBS11350_10728 [Aspergillus niger]KAI2855018.1 hypothetical protein CBS11232_4665 [Aspergillus niger]KAI2872121.1 hypothetical protein CBS115988_8055 [Aspergillu|eukprot:XP_001397168.2 hypothetical protein ANI_1_1678134 [Aspergillus niger CBS 513.88]
MPHKHKRREKDANTYNLPPNVIAKPLPVRDPSKSTKGKGGKGGKGKQQPPAKPTKQAIGERKAKSKSNSEWADDTPRAFRHLLQLQQKQQNGAQKKKRKHQDSDSSDSDEDVTPQTTNKNNKKRKAATTTTTSTTETSQAEGKAVKPQILPGEKLSDFAARVDREMPLSHMSRSAKPSATDVPKIRETRVTKHEKHLRRLQSQWRKEEAEILEKEAAEREEREEEMDEQLRLWKEWEVEGGKRKAKKKGLQPQQQAKVEADPWAKLKKERMNKQISPLDVVQAPPQLTKPREVFKVRGGAKVDVANVPAAGGATSLRRREELASERRNIVEEYRRLMAEKRRGQ